MSDELRVQIPGCSALSPRARIALEEELHAFGDDVFQEAGRLEDETEDISPKDIHKMADFVRKKNRLPSRGQTAVTVSAGAVSYAAAVIGGYYFNNLHERWGAIGACVCIFFGVTAFFVSRRKAGGE